MHGQHVLLVCPSDSSCAVCRVLRLLALNVMLVTSLRARQYMQATVDAFGTDDERTRARTRGASIASMSLSLHELDEETYEEPLEDHPDADDADNADNADTSNSNGNSTPLPPMPAVAAPPPPADYHDDLPPPPNMPAPVCVEQEALGVGGSSSAKLGRNASVYAGFQGDGGSPGDTTGDEGADGAADALSRKKSVYAGFGNTAPDGDGEEEGFGAPLDPATAAAARDLATELSSLSPPMPAARRTDAAAAAAVVDARDVDANHYGELSSASDDDDDYLAISKNDAYSGDAAGARAGDSQPLVQSRSEPVTALESAEADDAAGSV